MQTLLWGPKVVFEMRINLESIKYHLEIILLDSFSLELLPIIIRDFGNKDKSLEKPNCVIKGRES